MLYFRRGAVLTAAAFFSAAGCQTAAARRPSDVAPEVPIITAPSVPTGPVRFDYGLSAQRYRFSETTTIRATLDTASRVVTLRTDALVSVAVRELGDSIELVTTVDSGGIPVGGPVSEVLPPRGPTLDTVRTGVVAPSLSPRTCGQDTTLAAPATFRFFVPLPEVLDPGFVRRDTVVTVVCQRQIPIVARGARTVRSVPSSNSNAAPAIRVETVYSLEGAGVQGQHNVRIRGTGTAISEIVLDQSRGAVARGTNDLRLTMTVSASGRDGTVVQETRSALQILP